MTTLKDYAFTPSGELKRDIATFFKTYGQPKALARSLNLSNEVKRIGTHFGERNSEAEQAALLCRLACVVPADQRLALAQDLVLEILPEEMNQPQFLSQKISAAMSEELFGIKNENVLAAVMIHETLHPAASWLEKVVFLADKFCPETEVPYIPNLQRALARSIDEAIFVYLSYARAIQTLHPYSQETYAKLAPTLSKKLSSDAMQPVQHVPLTDNVKSNSMRFVLQPISEEK